MKPVPSLPAQARSILAAALREVDGCRLVSRAVTRQGDRLNICGKCLDLSAYGRIRLAAFGKAAPFMAERLARILGKRLSNGIVVARPEGRFRAENIRFLRASHPLPDRNSEQCGREILALARASGPKDLLFVLDLGRRVGPGVPSRCSGYAYRKESDDRRAHAGGRRHL